MEIELINEKWKKIVEQSLSKKYHDEGRIYRLNMNTARELFYLDQDDNALLYTCIEQHKHDYLIELMEVEKDPFSLCTLKVIKINSGGIEELFSENYSCEKESLKPKASASQIFSKFRDSDNLEKTIEDLK